MAVGIIAAAPALAQDAVQAGELYVQSDPPGGTVLLDGVDTGEVTPVLLRGLDPGPHDLRVLQGCALAEEQVLLRARLVTRAELTLEPGVGTVELASSPSGARVTLDGGDRGTTPITLDRVACGPHEIALSLEGHAPVFRSLELAPGDAQALELTLEALDYGTLVIIPEPLDAVVVVDGQAAGTGALTMEGVLAGTHEVEVRAVGLPPQRRTVEVIKDDVVRVELALVAPYAGPAGVATVDPGATARAKALRQRRGLAGVMLVAGAGLAGHGAWSYGQAAGAYDDYMAIDTMREAESFYDSSVAPHRTMLVVDLTAAGALLVGGGALWARPPGAWFSKKGEE